MSETATIWVVDDEPGVRAAFSAALVAAGYRVVESVDGLEALGRLREGLPALIVLDVDMPRLDGRKTLQELRRRGVDTPVLMITHVNDVDSRIQGLESGADDYIGKPCTAPELLARVRALLRRAPRAAEADIVLRLGDVVVNLGARTATRHGAAVRLTRTDFALLELLYCRGGAPVPREEILAKIWQGKSGASHALDTQLWRLRRKLAGADGEAPWLRNVLGVGYALHVGEIRRR
jgi:DNA-binding response OmpR family regulator